MKNRGMSERQIQLRDAILKVAEEKGLEVITVTIPMRKCDDVPNFLKRLEAFEQYSRAYPSKDRYGSYAA